MIAGPSFQGIRTAVQGFNPGIRSYNLSETLEGLPCLIEPPEDLSCIDRVLLSAGSTIEKAHTVAKATLEAYGREYGPATATTLPSYFQMVKSHIEMVREMSKVTRAYDDTVSINREWQEGLSSLQKLIYTVARFFLSFFKTLPKVADLLTPGQIDTTQPLPIITGPQIGTFNTTFNEQETRFSIRPTSYAGNSQYPHSQALNFYTPPTNTVPIAYVTYELGDNGSLDVINIGRYCDLHPGYFIQALIETLLLDDQRASSLHLKLIDLRIAFGIDAGTIKRYGFGVDEAKQEAVLYKLAEPIDGSHLSPDGISKAMLSISDTPLCWKDQITKGRILTTEQSPLYRPPADAGAGSA
jgi:hypothetical protein